MSMGDVLRKFNRLLSVEHYAVQSLRGSRFARDLEKSQKDILRSLRELGKSGDLSEITAIERVMIEAERAYYANSKSMDSSLNAALNELDVIDKHIGIVDDPVRYRAVDEAYSLPRNRKAGLPNDEARQALRSHYTRLNNMDKVRLGDVEKQIIDARKSNLFQVEKLYKERQAKTLGLGEKKTLKRSRGQ